MYYGLRDIQPTAQTICAYAEFLARTFKSPTSIRNYISGVRLLHKYVGVDSPTLYCFELDLILRSMDLTFCHAPKQKLPVTVQMLKQLCSACTSLGAFGKVLKCAILFGFYGFLRQSNLAPRSIAAFDPRRNTCRGDVIPHPPGLALLVKWTKTRQTGRVCQTLPLPSVPGHMTCPVSAFQEMTRATPTPSPNAPLLIVPGTVAEPVTIGQLNSAFSQVLQCLGYPTDSYSLHSLRRGGCSACYKAGVDFIRIKRHGTWTSDSFWDYVVTNTSDDNVLPYKLAASAARA